MAVRGGVTLPSALPSSPTPDADTVLGPPVALHPRHPHGLTRPRGRVPEPAHLRPSSPPRNRRPGPAAPPACARNPALLRCRPASPPPSSASPGTALHPASARWPWPACPAPAPLGPGAPADLPPPRAGLGRPAQRPRRLAPVRPPTCRLRAGPPEPPAPRPRPGPAARPCAHRAVPRARLPVVAHLHHRAPGRLQRLCRVRRAASSSRLPAPPLAGSSPALSDSCPRSRPLRRRLRCRATPGLPASLPPGRAGPAASLRLLRLRFASRLRIRLRRPPQPWAGLRSTPPQVAAGYPVPAAGSCDSRRCHPRPASPGRLRVAASPTAGPRLCVARRLVAAGFPTLCRLRLRSVRPARAGSCASRRIPPPTSPASGRLLARPAGSPLPADVRLRTRPPPRAGSACSPTRASGSSPQARSRPALQSTSAHASAGYVRAVSGRLGKVG
nr:basic proline-rich protein-like [Aegilops tauschii subsp. strangulata]